ncbi:MAG: hypothetical protein CVV06_09290 [Gammaproteobacteria bacterium HGW-Gammaproteobacteria-10]|nr:MAG: hypothetical protein CVV06_09290 [Gammaproteobacteria bacterium HGW-Gammaproteobacteria-10]
MLNHFTIHYSLFTIHYSLFTIHYSPALLNRNYSVPRQFSFPRSAWECLSTAPAVRDARASRSSFPRWSVGTIAGCE